MEFNEILVVEDNETMRLGIVESLKRDGYRPVAFGNGPEALAYFEKRRPGIVISDLKMEPMDGLRLLEEVKRIDEKTEVLLISAYGSIEIAVKAMQLGAADFLTKPFSPDELRIRLRKLAERMEQKRALDFLKAENILLKDELSARYADMIGISRPMQHIFSLIERIAGENSTVLIEGESGTGKELVARAIHQKSPRAEKPFIKVNCGALNDNLLASELFGHEKGAFTGAIKQKKGRFELAHQGTLFLDEIGDISPGMQIQLLRVLQEQQFERVGGEETLSVDVRIISATNKNLQKLMSEGNFREDLYYRLSVIPVKLPSLRERKEDIPRLIEHFLKKLTRGKDDAAKRLSEETLSLLQQYSWPGNIRELENLMERLLVISPAGEIDPQLVARQLGNTPVNFENYDNLPMEEAVYAFEKNLILHALKEAGGVKNRAAKLLGIGTSTLYYKLEKFGLLK
ncbi:MAG: sigma-54 dependent transcriptional regulator [Calditrichia bacterium]